MAADDDDERSLELLAIEAIFPELVIDPKHPFSASLELPITPAKTFPVIFPPLSDGTAPQQQLPTTASSDNAKESNLQDVQPQPIVEIRYLSHLPPLNLQITLPQLYPSEQPPETRLVSEASWIPEEKMRELQSKAKILWEENGNNQVLYDYIDFLQQAAEDGFGLVPQSGSALVLRQDLEVQLLDFDLNMKRQKFERETFDCGICLEPKKGAVCHRLQLCRHVFCIECLQDFYNNCITEGDITQVKCLTPNCEKETPRPLESGARRKRKIDRTLDPSELLQIPIEQEKVQRYIMLKKKKRLESNKNTIYCPRKWCQGPARTGKRRNDDENSDSDDNNEVQNYDPNANQEALPPPNERLAICEDCSFAFCRVCKISWHGEFQHCFPRKQYEISVEEKASEDYLRLHSTLCPTCNARCQKTMGCNHMICFQCKTHFCYLCSAWLDADNPYVHFNTKWQQCYQRLWELEGGDGVGDPQPAAAPPADIIDRAWDVENLPPPAPNPPPRDANAIAIAAAHNLVQQQRQGVRFNRRVQQGLARPAEPIQPRREAGLQRFIRLAADDREDEWDSDELDSDEDMAIDPFD